MWASIFPAPASCREKEANAFCKNMPDWKKLLRRVATRCVMLGYSVICCAPKSWAMDGIVDRVAFSSLCHNRASNSVRASSYEELNEIRVHPCLRTFPGHVWRV